MKKILLITTGGTISCGKGLSNLSPALNGEELLNLINIGNEIKAEYSDLLSVDGTSIKPKYWEFIAREILSKIDFYDGIVVTHGTDTLAYTAAMLSFLLGKIQKPVIITGSQKTIFEKNSDATTNLADACRAACCDVTGVYIMFGSKIIYGTRGYKESTSLLSGFVSVNCEYAGTSENGTVHFNKSILIDQTLNLPRYTNQALNAKVVSVNITPGDPGNIIKACADSGYNGLVLCGYGTGGIPGKDWESALKYAKECGIITVMTSQCRHGIIEPSRYAVGTTLERLGIISARDMTLESAYCKLLWLLSICNGHDQVRELFLRNMYGEISPV